MTLDYGIGVLLSALLALIWCTRSSARKSSQRSFHDRHWLAANQLVFVAASSAVTRPLGVYMYRVFEGNSSRCRARGSLERCSTA